MSAKKVLIVDDSVTMRALFANALEQSKELVVVGVAADAEQAAQMIAEHRPDVITLDIEMPGKNGIEFLAELMETNPMPVVMLSTLTQKGAEVSLKAIELGAVDCFPKPIKATPEEFGKIVGKLCKLVATAAKTNVKAVKAAKRTADPNSSYIWDGSVVGVVAGMGGVEAIGALLSGYPANCPPTIVLHVMDEGLAVPFASKLDAAIAPTVKMAADGLELQPGHVYFGADPNVHIAMDRWPSGKIRLLARDPVNEARPSADILFGVLAKVAGTRGAGVILSGGGEDGVAGLGAMRAAGARTFCQDAESAILHETAAAAIARQAAGSVMAPGDIGTALVTPLAEKTAA